MNALLLAAEGTSAPGTGRVDLSGAWDRTYARMVGGNADMLSSLELIGVVILVGSLGMWLWRRNQGAMSPLSQLWPAVAIGAVLVSPGVVIPVVLELADRLVNGAINLIGMT